MPSYSNEGFFGPSSDPSSNRILPSIESAYPPGPTKLKNGDVVFNYSNVDPKISELSVVFATIDGEILSEIPLKKTGQNSFSSIIPAKDLPSPYYRLSKETYDGEKESFVDPAARYLPNGVLTQDSPCALGQIIDQDNYIFLNPHPVPSSTQSPELTEKKSKDLMIAQIHPGTRTNEGTFNALIESGIIKKLADQGFDAIKFMPLGAVPGSWNWGYDGVTNSYSITQNYGTIDDFKRVIDKAHKHGLKVIVDLVFNHYSNAIESQELLYGKDAIKSKATSWGKGVNFNNEGIREFYLGCVRYFLEEFNIDGIRFDAAHILPVDFLKEAIQLAKKHNPNMLIIHEGTLTQTEDHTSLDGKYSNFYTYANGNMQWLIALLLTPETRHAWLSRDFRKHESNEDKVKFVAWELSKIKGHDKDVGFNHDFPGNMAPFNRIFHQLFSAQQDPVRGLSACRAFLSAFLSTPGLKIIFNGDEDGILSSPFTFFQTHPTEAQNKGSALGRVTECGEAIVHNDKDLAFIKSHWNGSTEQLEGFYNKKLIEWETYKNIAEFIPGEESTFQKAKIKQEDLDSEISQSWRDFFDRVVKFHETISSREHVFAASNTWGKSEIIAYENIEQFGSHNPIVGLLNPFPYTQHIDLGDLHYPHNGSILFNTNQEVDGVDTPTIIGNILTIPPFCMVYLDISKKQKDRFTLV